MKNNTSPSSKSDKEPQPSQPKIFWVKGEKGVKIDHLIFAEFLEDNGFYSTVTSGGGCEFVRIQNNVVEQTTAKAIKDFVRMYLLMKNEREVLSQLMKGANKYFGVGILEFLESKKLDLLKDSKDKAYFVFKNCVAVVTKNGIKIKNHTEIEKPIWKEQIIDRDFEKCKDSMGGDFAQFVRNTTDKINPKFIANRKALGYLLHNHHNPINPKAIILNDSDININSAKGGRGKGLYLKAVSKLRTTTIEDGKIWTPYKNFAYQKIKPSTQVFVLEDLSKGFDFESLFPILTDGVTVERKNRDAYTIIAKDLPKLAITSNYAIDRDGGSFERRIHDIDLSGYYSCHHRPIDDFEVQFFDGWNSTQWSKFDNFMLDCVRLYLLKGLGTSSQSIKEKILRENMNSALWDYLEENIATITTKTFYSNSKFLNDISDYDNSTLGKFTAKGISSSLKKYCDFKGFVFEKTRSAMGRGFSITPPIDDGSGEDLPF